MAPVTEGLTDLQREIFTKISQNEVSELKALLAQNQIKIDFVDENGMSPLQHACYKGNKEIVQMLLDQVGYVLIVLIMSCVNKVTFAMRRQYNNLLFCIKIYSSNDICMMTFSR